MFPPMSSSINLHLAIPSYEEATDGTEKFTVYCVHVSTSGAAWIVKKRYSDFHTFHTKLDVDQVDLPPFPAKKMKVLGMSKQDMEERRQRLEAYFQTLVSKASITPAIQIDILAFLEVYNHHPGISFGDLIWAEAADISEYRNDMDVEHWARLHHSKPIIEGLLWKRAIKSGRNFKQRFDSLSIDICIYLSQIHTHTQKKSDRSAKKK